MTSTPTSPADEALARTGRLVSELTGIRPSPATEARLVASLRRRVAARRVAIDSYPTILAREPAEQQALIELLSVQETSWFRDAGHFEALVRLVRAERHRPVVVWSAGTATGQEAWSLAVALHEAGIADFTIVATDLSQAALDKARIGRYDEHELRGLSPARRGRYLVRTATGGEVVPELRDHVRFQRHNVATEPAPLPFGTSSAVFCRNVFIYLEPEAILRATGHIRDVLVPSGHLFVGVSETLRAVGEQFELVRVGEPFAYRRREALRSVVGRQPAPAPRPPVRPAPVRSTLPSAIDRRADAELLARAGDHRAAAGAFRAAAFLDPDDVLSYFGLALALEELGDADAARRAYAAARSAVDRVDPARLEADLEGWGVDALRSLLLARTGGSTAGAPSIHAGGRPAVVVARHSKGTS
jgi:chemotaxis methyl-accepting protein methylase